MKLSRGRCFFILTPIVLGLSGCNSFKLTPDSSGRRLELTRVWSRETTEPNYLGARLPNRGGAILSNDLLIQGNGVDGIGAYNLNNGEKLWKIKVRGGVEAGVATGDGLFYFGGGDGQLYAVNAAGQVKWQTDVKAEVTASPTWYKGVVYVQNSNDEIFALDGHTGKQIWYYSRPVRSNLSLRGASSPVPWQDSILVGFSDGYLVRLDAQSGKLIWQKLLSRAKRLNDVDATVVVDGSSIFASSYQGGLFKLEAESGNILWSVEEGGLHPVTINKDMLFYATSEERVLALDKGSGKQIWSYPTRGVPTQLVYDQGRLLFGESDGGLVVLNALTGNKMSEYISGRGVSAPPTVGPRGRIFFISNENNLYALAESWNSGFTGSGE